MAPSDNIVDVSATRVSLLAMITDLARMVAPVVTSTDPAAVRLRLLTVLHAAAKLTHFLSQYDLGEELDLAAEELANQLAAYCKQLAQTTTLPLPELVEICTRFTCVLCSIYDAVLVTADP